MAGWALVGGPLCGYAISARSTMFVWVTLKTDDRRTVTAADSPSAGALLYRREESRKSFLYAGFMYRVCSGCDGVVDAAAGRKCPLCGGKLVSA